MNTAWQDYNDADTQNNFDLIPKGTIAPVRMTIKPGGLDDPNRGWTGGYATLARESDAVYLNCEFVVTAGEYARRKVWSLIGLHSPKGPDWGNMGRAFIRAILNSARSLSDKDTSPRAMEARRIRGFVDLDGIEFLAKIDVEKNANGDPKNVIKMAITPDMKEYQGFQPSSSPVAATTTQQAPVSQGGWQQLPQQQQPATQGWQPSPQKPPQQQQPAQAQSMPSRPLWAQ
ncbi:MAG: hypothetical protein HQL84_17125 [Magnetococcales bacterium]|nr:hypothetical protein [Magnetococcales bacterium]